MLRKWKFKTVAVWAFTTMVWIALCATAMASLQQLVPPVSGIFWEMAVVVGITAGSLLVGTAVLASSLMVISMAYGYYLTFRLRTELIREEL